MKTTTRIEIVLTSYNMGDVTEADFDAWASWVASHVEMVFGVDATVDQFRFGESVVDDVVRGGNETLREEIAQWLSVDGWSDFCADGAAWPNGVAS